MKIRFQNNLFPNNIDSNRRNLFSHNPKQNHLRCVNFYGKDLLDLSEKEIRQKAKDSIISDNFIGQGSDAEVYKIKDTDYCVRVPHISKDDFAYRCSKKILPSDKINHIVAKLGYGASILKYIDGIVPKTYENDEFSRYNLQSKIADMPIKAYSDLLHQIAEALKHEMFFDFSGGNLIVDIPNNKLTAIDFYKMSLDNPRPIKPLTEIYHVLTCYGSLPEINKKIYDNIVIAGLQELKPKNIPCMNLELFDFIDLALKRHSYCGQYKKGKISEIIDEYYSIRFSISNCLRSLKQTKRKEIKIKKDFPEINKKINELKRLMAKI